MTTAIEASQYERGLPCELAAAIVGLWIVRKAKRARSYQLVGARMRKLLEEDEADRTAAELLTDVSV